MLNTRLEFCSGFLYYFSFGLLLLRVQIDNEQFWLTKCDVATEGTTATIRPATAFVCYCEAEVPATTADEVTSVGLVGGVSVSKIFFPFSFLTHNDGDCS